MERHQQVIPDEGRPLPFAAYPGLLIVKGEVEDEEEIPRIDIQLGQLFATETVIQSQRVKIVFLRQVFCIPLRGQLYVYPGKVAPGDFFHVQWLIRKLRILRSIFPFCSAASVD
jgi:hypothetical protein